MMHREVCVRMAHLQGSKLNHVIPLFPPFCDGDHKSKKRGAHAAPAPFQTQSHSAVRAARRATGRI